MKRDEDEYESVFRNPDLLSETQAAWLPRYTEKQKEKLEAIQKGFKVLTEIEKRLVMLVYMEGLELRDIAKRLKLTEDEAFNVLQDLRQKIQKIHAEEN